MRRGALLARAVAAAFSRAKDYYSLLGVGRGASAADLRKAYVRLARELHPDRNPASDARQRFADVAEAYRTLSDAKRRAAHDRESGDGFAAESEEFFGERRTAVRGADVVLALEVGFEEAIKGTAKEIFYSVAAVCGVCKGSKCAPNTVPEKCALCRGTGATTFRRGAAFFQIECDGCGGAGETIAAHCAVCHGRGTVPKAAREFVGVPKGAYSGQLIRVSGKGDAEARGGPPGDLILRLHVKADPRFRREGDNVLSELRASVAEAVLGFTAEVPTVWGVQSVVVPPGTSHGDRLPLRGYGVPKPNGNGRGDHVVVVGVVVPKKLSAEQKTLFEQLKKLESGAKKEKKGWFR